MACSQTWIFLLLCFCYVTSCPLSGDLCMWNTFGFNYENSTNERQVLTSQTNRSYIQSLSYAMNPSSTCEMLVDYSLSPDTTLVISMNSGSNLSEIIAVLPHSNTSSSIQIPESDVAFTLTIALLLQVNSSADINATIAFVNFTGCTPPDQLEKLSCVVSEDRMCDGWTVDQPNMNLQWLPKNGYYEIRPEVPLSSAIAKLVSPRYPYSYGKSSNVTYEHFLRNSTKHHPRRFMVRIFFYDSKGAGTWPISVYPKYRGYRKWYSEVIDIEPERIEPEHIIPERIVSFQLEFLFFDADNNDTLRIANITVSMECIPQLLYNHPTRLNISESLNGYITHAVNLSVADRATSYTFASCGSAGRTGPTAEQCNEYYGSLLRGPYIRVEIDGMSGVQQWNVTKSNTYDVMLYGASGGFGVETRTSPTSFRGFSEYWTKNAKTLPIWPSFVHVKLDLYEGDKLHIVVGQAGSTACPDKTGRGCQLEDDQVVGGGGGGGGASIVYLERNGTVNLVAIAGGGGGMGRQDMAANDSYKKYLQDRCDGNICTERKVRPGLGGSLKLNVTSGILRQDGFDLAWPFRIGESLNGGGGCDKYLKNFDTSGGFGGGGGGCTAGGGGGGYVGGTVSMDDDQVLPGMPGLTWYARSDVITKLIELRQYNPFSPKHPNGYVEVTEEPPPCECDERPCQWSSAGYTDYKCLCNGIWVSKHLLHTNTCTRGTMEQGYTMSPSKWSTVGVIILTFVICAVVLAVVIGIIHVVRRKTNACKGELLGSAALARIGLEDNPNYIMFEDLPDIIPKERITVIRLLGEGTFSTVFEARLALADSCNSPEITVAIKKPKDNSVQTHSELLQEAKIIKAFDHPNIIRIIGLCELSDGIIGIVMDVLLGGDLRTFLKEHRPNVLCGTQAHLQYMNSASTLLFGDLINISCQIASACEYLEEKKYIHRDIAARNVLLTERGPGRVAKISDFGLSRDINSGDYCRRNRLHPVPVPVRWYPPEAFKNNGQTTTKSDVWSFGVLLWEIFTFGEQPYPSMDNQQVAEMIGNRYTMDAPLTCPPLIGDLMKKCWMYEAKDRPDFAFVYFQLCRLLENDAIMASPVTDFKHSRLSSVASSVSSGFDEMPESPSCLSMKPLLDNSYNST